MRKIIGSGLILLGAVAATYRIYKWHMNIIHNYCDSKNKIKNN